MAEAINSKESRNHWNFFLENINQSKEALGSQEVLWYRGQADYDYKLIPSLLRMKNGLSREKFLFQEYKRAAIWFQDKRETDWETLFDMQHYWIPTRLLDWTEVLGIAIAFAIIKQRQTGNDAAIFILNPKV